MKTVYDLLDEYKDFLDGTNRFESFKNCVVLNLKLHDRKQSHTLFLSGIMAMIFRWKKLLMKAG